MGPGVLSHWPLSPTPQSLPSLPQAARTPQDICVFPWKKSGFGSFGSLSCLKPCHGSCKGAGPRGRGEQQCPHLAAPAWLQRCGSVGVRDAGRKPVSANTVLRIREGVSLTFYLGSAQRVHISIVVTQSFIHPALWVRDTSTRGRAVSPVSLCSLRRRRGAVGRWIHLQM